MNFKKLENNLLDMIQEQQVKIGYMSGVTRFYYPLQSLNRLLGTELTEEEMLPLGIKNDDIQVDFAEGDMVVVTAGAWKDTAGVITAISTQKQTVTINVELFGRETPVEISFADIQVGGNNPRQYHIGGAEKWQKK